MSDDPTEPTDTEPTDAEPTEPTHAEAAPDEAGPAKSSKGATLKVWAVDLLIGAVVAVIVVLGVNWWNGRDEDDSSTATTFSGPTFTLPTQPTPTSAAPPIDPAKSYTATIETDSGTIVIALDTESAPTAAGQFVKLATSGFYDGLTFHRVIDGFMIQGGDPNGDGTGGSGTAVIGEVPSDNYPIGSLAAAKAASDPPGTFDSQFFIVTGSQGASLPNDYARFGTVTEGIEVAQAIAALQDGDSDTPSKPVQIVKVSITES